MRKINIEKQQTLFPKLAVVEIEQVYRRMDASGAAGCTGAGSPIKMEHVCIAGYAAEVLGVYASPVRHIPPVIPRLAVTKRV